MKLSVYMYFFLPSSFFMLLLLYLLKQRSYSIIYEALLCVIFFFVHTDVGQILKIICMSQCQNSSKFLSVSYLMKTADVIMNFFSSHNTTDHT